MVNRRFLLAGAGLLALPGTGLAAGSFDDWLAGLRAEARRGGISAATLQRAFAGVQPNSRVLELDRRQPEFTMTWDQYRDRIVSPQRVENGRRLYVENRSLLDAINARFRVSPRVVLAIWGMESNFGAGTGNFNVIEATATLAWDGRRAEFFRRELLAALRILDAGHITPERMKGSWSGAMGQPQFMPTSFERLAVDFDGDGRKDIWDSRADALASVANYLARSGWREDELWGREVILPGGFDPSLADRRNTRSVAEWSRMGVRRADGSPLPVAEVQAAILIPGGLGGQAFAVYPNFNAIRRYNPSDFYSLAVGILSDRVA
ncbi:lytic murein transglycosylase [Roseomonas sp. NAR14]|uniref:Lytic murein transglycosylase n=1 Tax=Roseomonas acroporae TaxID=2937791 RepID=A0A9X1Y5Z5_9PROT|nr:lytic murein transglycosylase [Roseomonas acroporae]MCK8783727.1 lytic murein transglycosylase [Roseomonas acroporae]